jgi:hypothetical protein
MLEAELVERRQGRGAELEVVEGQLEVHGLLAGGVDLQFGVFEGDRHCIICRVLGFRTARRPSAMRPTRRGVASRAGDRRPS